MITPKWLNTRSQPIAIRNVIDFMKGVVLKEYTYNKSFDIGGPEILTYKEMLLRFAQIRGLKRRIFTIPIMTPRFSSYWLFFVTSTSYKLAVNLVNSMSVEVICRKNNLHELLGIKILTYDEAIKLAFDKIKQQDVLSSWTDALSSQILDEGIDSHIEIPVFGCYTDKEHCRIANDEKVLEKIWTLGGHNGWYYANWLWGLRGLMDKMVGGVGLRRGRRNDKDIEVGDALDFWRVLYASKRDKRLLLYAEMKIPGEAWLEFKIVDGVYYQTATFRPLGIWGRTYWYAVAPFHLFIFKGLMRKIVN